MSLTETQDTLNYQRIAKAIQYIKVNFKARPALEQIAEEAGLSPFHFQRLFSDWAGVSPKQFIAYLGLDYAKSVLKEKELSLFDVAQETGLSGTGRLHDLFVKIEGMTPGEFKNGGEKLTIHYNFSAGLFGNMLIASTGKGICHMAFIENEREALEELKLHFPNASYIEQSDAMQESALSIFDKERREVSQVKVHLKGTPFQLKVWESLLKIPKGGLSSYGEIASAIGSPGASRAVGSAIGENPVAFIIPCHRVIRAGGEYGQFRWGSTRKSALIGWEAAKTKR